MVIKYQIFVDKNLLIVKYEGVFNIEKYKAQVLDVIQKPEWNSIHKILTDLRSVTINNGPEVIDEIIDIKENSIKKKHISVQLVNKPTITALSHLLQLELNNKDFETDFCSSVKKSIKLLELNDEEIEFEKILSSLEHTF